MSTTETVNKSNYVSFADQDRNWASETALINALCTNSGIDYNQAVFVGKHGADAAAGSNPATGLTPAKANLTIAQAIINANGLSPASNKRIPIVILDGGNYAENVTLPAYVDLHAPVATITGKVIVSGNNVVQIYKIDGSTEAYAFANSTAGTINADIMSITGGVTRTIYSSDGTMNLDIDNLDGDVEAVGGTCEINYSVLNRESGSDVETAGGTINTADASTITAHIAATSGVHGAVGDVVGTSDIETLTNKTMDADNNTFSNFDHGAEVDNPSSGVHGVTGNVVGTTDIQTLTNKTLTSPTINGATIQNGSSFETSTIQNTATIRAKDGNLYIEKNGSPTIYGVFSSASLTAARGYTFPDVNGTLLTTGNQSDLDHGSIAGLSDDDHSQYFLLTGRSGGTTAIGGTDASDNLVLSSTSNATKGNINIGSSGNSYYDEVNDYLYISERLSHAGDTDTYIELTDDTVKIFAGTAELVEIKEDTQDSITFNSGQGDVDFYIKRQTSGNALRYIAGDDKIYLGSASAYDVTNNALGIGTDSPGTLLDCYSSSAAIEARVRTVGAYNAGLTLEANRAVTGLDYTIRNKSDGTLKILQNNNIIMDVDTGGNVVFNASNQDFDFTIEDQAGNPAYVFDAGTYFHTFNNLMRIEDEASGHQIIMNENGIDATLWNDQGFLLEMESTGGCLHGTSFNGEGFNMQGKGTGTIIYSRVSGSTSHNGRCMGMYYGGTTSAALWTNGYITTTGEQSGIEIRNDDVPFEIGNSQTDEQYFQIYPPDPGNANAGYIGIYHNDPQSRLDVGGSFGTNLVTKTADYTADGTDSTIIIDASGANVTITLPAAANCEGRIYNIKAVDITNTATVDGNGAETIDGSATYVFISQYESITIQSDGTEWWII